MTLHRSMGLPIFVAAILSVVPVVGGRLVRFEHGYSYQYQYQANVTLEQVDTFQSAAKVYIKNIANMDDASELLLEISGFRFQLNDQSAAHNYRPDFTKWFSIVMSHTGEVKSILYDANEDGEILNVKKAITALLAGTYLDKDMAGTQISNESWSYTTRDMGHEGKHYSMYRVVPNSNGKLFTKSRVLYKHPAQHADSNLEKIIYIDDNLGTIHSVSVNETMTASHSSKSGFDPYYAMRKVDAINEFEQIDYPTFKAKSVGKLRFLQNKIDGRDIVRPANVKLGYLHLSNEKDWKAPPQPVGDVSRYGSYIQSNLTCMRKNEDISDFTSRLDCFHNIVSIMRVMSVEDLSNLTQFFFNTSNAEHIVVDRTAILDALGAMGTDISQNLLLKYIFQRRPADDDMVQRALIHVATMKDAPNQNILTFLQMALVDDSTFCNKYSLATYHRTILTIGSVTAKCTKTSHNETAGKLLDKLHSMVGIHDPWTYRKRRELMTEEEQLQYDNYRVILLEALGNGGHDESYEYIVSHVNATNSQWIKRAAIHALRNYHHSHAAKILLDLAQTDDNEEVRHDALLQYKSHPNATKQQPLYSRQTTTSSPRSYLPETFLEEPNVSRHKREILNAKLDFKLQAPSIDWQKRVGSDAIGGSFGVLMLNFLHLQISPLSGLFRVAVHDEVYARVHLGFLGRNVDFFSARICFKGGTRYNVNILQEFDPRLNQENLQLVTESLGNIVGGIRTGVDMISSVIKGVSGDWSLKNVVDEFLYAFRDIPNKILNLRSTAVKMARELGEFIVLELPPFVQPLKDLVEYVSNLFSRVKSDFMDFYTSIVQIVETTIPNAAETLYKSTTSIIENFPQIFKDPKTAVAKIGKAVTRIALTLQQLNKTKEHIKESVNLKVLPFLTNIDSEYETLIDMIQMASDAIKNKGTTWIHELIDGEDPIDVVTGGKMSTADLRRRVVLKLQSIIDDISAPFANLINLGQLYSEKFSRLFSLISDVKKAYNMLKTGYKQARAVIETIFGPKCHTDFPRLIRLSDMDCSGDGFFPSHLGRVFTEYEHRGIDIVIESGKSVVSPFSGVIVLTKNNNEVKLVDMQEMIKGTEVIITNVKPAEDIGLESDRYYTTKQVAAGDTIGTAVSSPCSSSSNHIHFTVLKNGKPVDPTRFLQPRRPSPPKWEQICDDYKFVFKGKTLDAGSIVGVAGRSKEDTSGHLPNDGETPTSLDTSAEPSHNHDNGGLLEKLRQAKRRKKRGVLDTAKNMIGVLVENIEAFLDQFSISRITMGNIVSFIDLLELENTKTKLAQTLKTIQNAINNKPCKTPDAMTTEELQMELTVRGLSATGGRRNMINTLTATDERCPSLALGIPEVGNLYCSFDSQCLGIQCCLTLRVADLIQLSYQAYAIVDIDEMSLTVGFENWKHAWNLELREQVIEDTVRPSIKFELLELEVLCRYKIQIKEHAIILTFGAGLCSVDDSDICLAYVNVIEDTVFPLPKVLENGTLVMQKVDWNGYFELETVRAKIEEAGQHFVSQSTDIIVDRLLSALNIPKEFLQNNPRCLLPENLSEEELRTALREKGLSTEGIRTEQEHRLRIAYRTCYPADGRKFTFPEIDNGIIRNYFYYFTSKDCLRIDACLDVTVENLQLTKTFSSFIELIPCSFQLIVGIEKWRQTIYLIDFDWGAVNKIILTESVYLSFTLDKSTDKEGLILDAELVVSTFNFNVNFMRSQSIPTPGCGGHFKLPGKGDLVSLAEAIGGQLSEKAFEIFLSSIGIADIIRDQHCVLLMASTDCKVNVDEYIPASLQSIVKCEMLDNCWGLNCCIDFTLNIPLSSKTVPVSIPFMFRYDPCQYFAEIAIGKHTFKEWLFEYDWGLQENITLGTKASITISYDVKRFDEGFTVDVKLAICIPIGDDDTLCIPHDNVMHLIENEYIPACVHELHFIKGFPDFSFTEWMQERGKMIGDEIGEAGKDFLIDKLNLKDFLLSHECDRKRHPFSPTVNGWNIACNESLLNIPTLPDFLACHVDESCSRIVCCIDIEVIGLSLKFDLNIDLCGNSIIATFESVQHEVDNALSNYEWDREKTISIAKVLSVKYKIQKPGRNTYVVYAQLSVCLERDGSCFLNTTFFDGIEIPRRICGSVYETCMVLEEDIKHQCAIDADCFGITCDVMAKEKSDLPAILVSYRMDFCTNDVRIQVFNKKWERSISSVVLGEIYSRSVSENLMVSFSLGESSVEYRVDLNLTTCGFYTTYSNCSVIEVLTDFPIKKTNCTELKNRKKRDIQTPKTSHLKDGMKDLWTKQATNEEIDQFLQSIVNSNVQQRHANYEAMTIAPSDIDTSLLSRLRALGHNNPMSIPFAGIEFKAGSTFDIDGADALFQLLDDADDLYEHGEKAFLIGKGLTKKGIRQLADMIANMTIGDLEALLDMSNINPAITQQIINDLIDLATALYSETADAIFSEKLSNAFESFDVVLRGTYNFPEVIAPFFELSFPIPMGPVTVDLAFSAGCSYSMGIGVNFKVMNMLGEPFVTPKGGVQAYAALRICFGPFCAELRLTGSIMAMKFPTTAEVSFSKFPLEVGLRMDLHIVPLRLDLAGLVTIRISIPFCCSFSVTVWKKTIWSYRAPLIQEAPLFSLSTKDKDPDPPKFESIIETGAQANDATPRKCEVAQLPGYDYTEPAFQIATAASDSLSRVSFFLDVGTAPGGTDVMNQKKLGGAQVKMAKVLSPTGLPLYFTMFAKNSQGSRSSVTCELPTYDITPPTGRFEAAFSTTSNPDILKASVVVQDDSPIVEAYVGIGYGAGIYGDQIKRFTPVSLKKRNVSLKTGDDPRVLEQFTGMKNGRLIGEIMKSENNVQTAGDCARLCLKLPTFSCLSINYDYGTSGLCELLKSIEGHDFIVAQDGLFSHYERLGTGHAVEFSEAGLFLDHNFLYYFNLDITNSLGYRSIIPTKGILTDFSTPEPGVIKNAKEDFLETIPCSDIIPEERKDWQKYCIGVNTNLQNHRVVIDGEGSRTVFNGPDMMTDMKFTRTSNYISANWDGFRDNETSIRGYTFAVGDGICNDLIHPHHDPHRHLQSEEHWDNRGQIYPIPPPYTNLPDGRYFISVRALNKVMYGGPLSTTVCHTTPYIVDNSAPFVHEISNLRYDEKSLFLYGDFNISDPHSGIAEYDIGFGDTSRTCNLLPWFKYNYTRANQKIAHKYKLPDGVPVWVRIRAVNNVLLPTIGVADHAIILDGTGPFPGKVYDGPSIKTDIQFSKYNDEICVNWFDFYDPESGVSKYMVGVGTKPGLADIVRLTQQSSKQHSTCFMLDDGNKLEHGKMYYGVVRAFNGAIFQRSRRAISDGAQIDLSPPEPGIVVDGRLNSFTDQRFSSSKSSVDLQWDHFSDPESGIKEFYVKVTKENGGVRETLKDWVVIPNTMKYASWNSFHNKHKDQIKSSLRVRNGAMNDLTVETDGVLIDLTAPVLTYLYDGSNADLDLDFQSDGTQVSCVFESYDPESGIESLKFQVYEKKGGRRRKVWPDMEEWETYTGESMQRYNKTGLQLMTGALYTIRVGVTNNAGAMAIHETNGVKLDLTEPEIKWLHVGVFNGENEDIHNGYVYQTDHSGIKISLLVVDPESGVSKINIRVGTSPGSDDVRTQTQYSGTLQDLYVTDLILHDTDTSSGVFEPVYYVTVVAYNGAGLQSVEKISNPIAVLPEDVPGIVYDGIQSSQEHGDVDYDSDFSSVSVSFNGFQSTSHGIASFFWAVGTAPGLEDIQPYTEYGITSLDDKENGSAMTFTDQAQMPVNLKYGETYFSTVRGITNGGNVLESTSNGVLIDATPGTIVFDSTTDADEAMAGSTSPVYLSDLQQFEKKWYYFDDQYKTPGVLDNIELTWMSIGTYPLGENIKNITEQTVSPTYAGHLSGMNIGFRNAGLPYILNVYTKNKAGYTAARSAPAFTIDTSAPSEGKVTCSNYIQPQDVLKCTWTHFFDYESSLAEYRFSLGTQEGYTDLISRQALRANTTWFQTDASKLPLQHGMTMYATVTAINGVKLETYQFSNKIMVDSSPPVPGVVVELSQEHAFNESGDSVGKEVTCQTAADCQALDTVCQEALVSVDVAWQAFRDDESGISHYQIAVGTTEGGVEIQDYTTIDLLLTGSYTYRLSGINLYGAREVFVKVKAFNGAGLSTISLSNGVFISYVSQGLSPLLPIGIWDADPATIGDINYQTDSSTIRAAWDVTGDPCPAVQFEWAIERLDGQIIQDFIVVQGGGIESNDRQNFQNGETYYSLLKVTNALGFQYVLRSDGVTVHTHPLAPGSVYDGDIFGYDLSIINSKTTVTCNWENFGVAVAETVESVLTGNIQNRDSVAPDNQEVSFYEVGLGSDRRHSETKDDVAAFRNVGKQTYATFTGLDLIAGNAVYYCTVRAYSIERSTASVTSNGFSVNVQGGVLAMDIIMRRFITSESEMSVQWVGFESKADMMLYYIAVADSNTARSEDCKHYVDSPDALEEKNVTFNVQNVKGVALNTHVTLENLTLQHGKTYYVYVIGVDFSGECNMTIAVTTVDLTPPGGGHITAGPYYEMKLTFTTQSDRIFVEWEDYEDKESGIDSYVLSTWRAASCAELHSAQQVGDPVKVGHTVRNYLFRDVDFSANKPYIVKLQVMNQAGLSNEDETSPILFDDSKPLAGKVVEGLNYRSDVVFWGATDKVQGTMLHFPSPSGLACPSRSVSFRSDPLWNFLDMEKFQQPDDKIWKLQYIPAHAKLQETTEYLEIKMSRDTKYNQMLSGGIFRPADLAEGGVYELSVKAAGGNGFAVTEIMFLEATLNDFQTFIYKEETDWTENLCSCCLDNSRTNDCLCSNCEEYLESLHERVTDKPTTSQEIDKLTTTVPRLSTTKREGLVFEDRQNPGSIKTDKKAKQKGCGLQIINGPTPFVIVWCRFFNDTNRDMKMKTELQFDPTDDFHSYKMVFSVVKEELIVTWELEVYIDGLKIQKFSGIPRFKNTASYFIHVWNKDNYVPELLDVFDNWMVKAVFKNLIFPPKVGELCRYGEVFQSGENPIVRYEAGIGSQKGITDIQPFSEVISPCIPCEGPCSNLHCDPLCRIFTEQLTFSLENLTLPTTLEIGNETKIALYYLAVRAVLSSRESVVSYSDGFYIDTTPPTFNLKVLMYIDVDQSDYTPVEFQGCNHTIKGMWLCEDEESEIQNYEWAIGSTIGKTDIQEFLSTGDNPTGINSKLEGVLKHRSRYYLSIKCTNEAGLTTLFSDTKGVEVLLEAPDSNKVKGHTVGAEAFDTDVNPPNSQKSDDHEAIGVSWEVMNDPSIIEYDFCVGGSKSKLDDIFQCVWVGYNDSGSVEIQNGYLMYAGQQMYSLRELGQKAINNTGPGKFKIETGRILFPAIRVCNQAKRCTWKPLETVTITSNYSSIRTATEGSALVFSVSPRRLKRDTFGEDIIVRTPSDLQSGQTVIVSILTDEELQEDYGSDASEDFVPYISNPNVSVHRTERLLFGRIQTFMESFSITSVGQLSMTGPIIVSFPQLQDDPNSENEIITMLIHWNPDYKEWQISSRTCINEPDTLTDDPDAHRTVVKICDTRAASAGSYFYAQTQFATVVAKAFPINNAPELQAVPVLKMLEDEGTLILQLVAYDTDGDDVDFFLLSSVYDFHNVASEMQLDKNGSLTFTPCQNCYGTLQDIKIELIDKPGAQEIKPLRSFYSLSIEVEPVNDAPVIFLLNDEGDLILHPDPTEEIKIFLENRHGIREKFSGLVGAFDVDANDELTISTRFAANGTFSLMQIDTAKRDAYFECNATWCLDTVPATDPRRMTWVLSRVSYVQDTTYSGIDSIQIVVQDSLGTYSDPVTLKLVVMEMPCLHGGECIATSGITCSDERRVSDFFDNYACACPLGWSGRLCDEDVNECDLSPCSVPYACNNIKGSYECYFSEIAIALIVVSLALLAIVICLFLCRHKLRAFIKRRMTSPKKYNARSLRRDMGISVATQSNNARFDDGEGGEPYSGPCLDIIIMSTVSDAHVPDVDLAVNEDDVEQTEEDTV